MNVAGESNAIHWQLAPTYSELFGLGVRTTVGGYVSEDFALGAIIDVGQYREEYLANAGLRLSDTMRVVGSVGLLKEQEEFVIGDGREDVRQLEYGLSLKGNYDAGIVRGFEVNAYKTNASSDTDNVETGDLTGLQVVTQLKPSDSTDIRIGAGFERAEWATGETDEGLTLQALGSHKLFDKMSMTFEAKSAEIENVYGLGLAYDMSTADIQNSALNVNLMQIEGKHGISDDTRVAINWTMGLGGAVGSSATGASETTAASIGSVARADLLADVMMRPAFLHERVLTRTNHSNGICTAANYENGVGTWNAPQLSGYFYMYMNNIDNQLNNAIGTFELYTLNGSTYTDTGISVTFTTAGQGTQPTTGEITPALENYSLFAFAQGVGSSCDVLQWDLLNG